MADPAARPRKRARDGGGGDGAASTAGPGPGTSANNGHASNGNGHGTASPAAAGGSAPAMSTASVQASTAVGDPYQQATSADPGSSTAAGQHAPAPASSSAATTRPATYDRRDRPLSRATLDQSFFCVEPHDEFTREVGDWIWGWIHNRQNVEIEAKIGLLVDNRPGLPPNSRVTFPLGTETILTDASFCKFVSNMTLRQHHHFNQILNLQVGEASQPHWQGAPIRYTHTKEIDAFYPTPPGQGQGQGQGGNRTRIRVTKDEKDRDKPTAKACVEKTRVADMNIFSPKRGFDFRISISVETPVPLPRTKATHERWKNRVSYQHQAFQVDLTQVKAADSKETLHELEVEFSDMPLLMQEGYQKDTEEGSLYYDLVQVFLNNIRMLIRNAAPP